MKALLCKEDGKMATLMGCGSHKGEAVSSSVPCATAGRCAIAVADVYGEAVRFFAYCFFYYFCFCFYFYGKAQGSPQGKQKMA
jgi:hypothetical protein